MAQIFVSSSVLRGYDEPKILHSSTNHICPTGAETEQADGVASAETAHVRGTLRLNVPVSFGIIEIAPIIPSLCSLYPDLSIDLGFNDRHIDLIEEGWDLIIRIGDLEDSTLVARHLAPCRTVLCAAPKYIAAYGHPRTVEDLRSHRCLGYTLSRSHGADR